MYPLSFHLTEFKHSSQTTKLWTQPTLACHSFGQSPTRLGTKHWASTLQPPSSTFCSPLPHHCFFQMKRSQCNSFNRLLSECVLGDGAQRIECRGWSPELTLTSPALVPMSLRALNARLSLSHTQKRLDLKFFRFLVLRFYNSVKFATIDLLTL